MSVHIEADGGRVLIKADDGSHVSNISVGGRQFVAPASDLSPGQARVRQPRITRHQKLQLVFAAWMGVCIAIFVLMIYGFKI